jgi:predicted nucleic acid-binding protein
MTGSRLFIDTSPLIYFVEKSPAFFERVSVLLADSIKNNSVLVTSPLTAAEFGIKPRKLNRPDILKKFEKTVKTLFEVQSIAWDVGEISSILRAKYPSLKAIDSLQIACALKCNCDTFVTNDRRLKAIKEIQILLIKDL